MIKTYDLEKSFSSNAVTSLYGGSSDKSLKAIINIYEDKTRKRRETRGQISKAIDRNDIDELRRISSFFYTSNPTYSQFIEYMSNMLCFYWMVSPHIRTNNLSEEEKNEAIDRWWDILYYIETINPEVIGPYIARKTLLDGACYIAVKEKTIKNSAFGIQYLPIKYCRVAKRYVDRDVVDFNVKYFDEKFSTLDKKREALASFPPCITEKYYEWKALKNKTADSEWMSIDPDYAYRFTLRGDEAPFFIGIVLDLLDLQDVKDITMFKMEQELSKIIVQKFGTNKDGMPIVEKDVLDEFHKKASAMVKNIPGVDVITTYAEIDSVDLQQNQGDTATSNPIKKITENVYNSAGISKLLFNAENAGTLPKSIITNETTMFVLLKQIKSFLKNRIDVNFKKGKVGKNLNFGITMPELTYSNRVDMSKLFKEQASIGYSKFMPAIALGERQSEIMSMLYFENDILELVDMMKPPASSNTISASSVEKTGSTGETVTQGRPKKDENEVSEKTVQNRETAA